MVVDEPLHAPLEPLQPIHDFGLEHLHRKQRHQAHHGAYLEEMVAAIGQMEHVVVKTVLLIPELNALTAAIVHGVGDVNKVLEEFAGHILIDRKSTRLNSSHGSISYAVFCLKKKKYKHQYN